ncbi:MAG: hypothetical protein ACKVS8_12165 [Phycisphaerales bacterium]
MRTFSASSIFGCAVAMVAAAPAVASFHFMQIEQFIAGINGDITAQAVQLRMRAGGQNLVNGTTIRCYDAAGLNPITLCTLNANVPVSTNGSRILIATPSFIAKTTPNAVANFTMAATIPADRLAAGRLTFQSGATIYWSISWGGAAYTGSQTGSTTNDANGNFGPAFASPAPSTTLQSLRYTPVGTTVSTTNAADYGYSAAAAVFTNNAGATFTVTAPEEPCAVEYNNDGSLNPDDLGDFITDYYTLPHIPGPGGYAISCPGNPPPYDVGYKTGFTTDGSGQCNEPFPDNLGDYITAYYQGCPA